MKDSITLLAPVLSTVITTTATTAHSDHQKMSNLKPNRSRFMINDILAGSAAANAAAAVFYKQQQLNNNNNNNIINNNEEINHGPASPNSSGYHLAGVPAHPHEISIPLSQQQQHIAAVLPSSHQYNYQHQRHLHQQQLQQQQHNSRLHALPPAAVQHNSLSANTSHGHSPTLPAQKMHFPAGTLQVGSNGLNVAQYAAAMQQHYAQAAAARAVAVAAVNAADRSHNNNNNNNNNNNAYLDDSSDYQDNEDCDSDNGSGDHLDDNSVCSNGAKDDDGTSIKSGSTNDISGLSKKQRKARTAFSDHQLQTLEKSFERQKYLSVQERQELAHKLDLSDCQVKTWYQNRRTKWKRQTAVGLELLAEAGNFAAFQRLYGGSPYLGAWAYPAAQAVHGGPPPSSIDLYYRQAAAAAAMQKPIPYNLYAGVPNMTHLTGLPVPPVTVPFSHLSASTSLSSLSNYYQTATGAGQVNSTIPPSNNNAKTLQQTLLHVTKPLANTPSPRPVNELSPHTHTRSPSPTLNPGSPPSRSTDNVSHVQSDDEHHTPQ